MNNKCSSVGKWRGRARRKQKNKKVRVTSRTFLARCSAEQNSHYVCTEFLMGLISPRRNDRHHHCCYCRKNVSSFWSWFCSSLDTSPAHQQVVIHIVLIYLVKSDPLEMLRCQSACWSLSLGVTLKHVHVYFVTPSLPQGQGNFTQQQQGNEQHC